jgi:hypothetical protein
MLLRVWVWGWVLCYDDGQAASLSWSKAPIWGLRPDLYYMCDSYTVLFLWGALSDKRSGLSFVYAAGPCQRSLSRIRVPSDLRPYFTVSDLRLPFSSPPTTRRVTVEVFDPASTRRTPPWVVSYREHHVQRLHLICALWVQRVNCENFRCHEPAFH